MALYKMSITQPEHDVTMVNVPVKSRLDVLVTKKLCQLDKDLFIRLLAAGGSSFVSYANMMIIIGCLHFILHTTRKSNVEKLFHTTLSILVKMYELQHCVKTKEILHHIKFMHS